MIDFVYFWGIPGSGTSHLRWLLVSDIIKHKLKTNIVDFFQNNVYSTQRSWHNWIVYEKKYKKILDNISHPSFVIPKGKLINDLFHDLSDMSDQENFFNIICISPISVLKKYHMVNTMLDNVEVSVANLYALKWQKESQVLNYKNNILWQYKWFLNSSDLSKNLTNIQDKLNLHINHNEVEDINQLWLNCWTNAHKDFLDYFKNI